MKRTNTLSVSRLALICVLFAAFKTLWGGTFTAEYSSVKYDKTGSINYALSIPTLNGQPLQAIRGVVISHPGLGGNTAYQVNERWAKWLYENGFAYIGNDSPYSASSLSALADYADDDLGGNTYPELAYAPVCVFGESAGGSSTAGIAYANPERVIAFVVEHTRFYTDFDDVITPAEEIKAVPGYYRWGEWDHGRFNEGYFSAGGGEVYSGTNSAKSAIHSMIARGALWMTAIEHRQDHATKRYAFEEAMGFFGLMLPLRYDYQEGVAGKDPKLGAVTLTPIARESGYLGEHIYGAIQTQTTLDQYDQIDAANTYYPNFLKDWESRDPYYAPFAEFTRLNKNEGHSWMANADVAAFWATKFSHGNNDLHFEVIDGINDAFGSTASVINNRFSPNHYDTAQTIRVFVDPVGFPNTERVEFYANSTLKGTVENAPFEFAYSFDSNETGMFALYAVAISSTGERCVGPRRMVQVYPNTRAANTAPTISNIGKITGNPNQTLSIPFTVGDAEGSPLTVVWREANRANLDSGSYTATIGGSGNNRTLDLTLPSTPGIIWGLVRVSDGDISTNAYITIHVTGDGSAIPFFVGTEAIGAGGRGVGQNAVGAWTKRLSVHIYDYDTDPRNLTLTATSSNQTAIPDENIRIGGAGEFRYIQVKPLGYATITMTLSDGNNSVSESFALTTRTQANTPPVISAIPNQSAFYSNASTPIEVRIYDLHTPSEELVSGESILNLTVTSGNQSIIQDANITVTQVGPRRLVSFTPEYNQTGTVTLTATVTDAEGLTASTTFDVLVDTPPALAVSGGTLANATITQSYNRQLTATGGIQPYTWSLTSGSLPTGLTLNADGTIAGTPSVTGNFTFTAQATDSNPGGSVSESGTFSLDVLSLLTPPQDFSASAETNTTITLSWTDTAAGETGYAIERRIAGDVTWTSLTTTSANAITHTDSNALAAGTTYEYRLRAVGTHNGVYTDTVTVTAIGTPAITAQPQSTAVLSGSSVNFSVTATGGELSYQWYEGNSGITTSPVSGETSSTLTVANITASRTFWVRITNPAGSVDSNAATVSISQQAPSLKVNLGADLGGTWNSYATFDAFNGNLSETYSNLIFTSGSNADGVSLTMTRTSTSASFCYSISDQTATAPTSDWLTDAAAQSFWFINLNNGDPSHQLAFSVAGLPAGTYDIEAYVYVNPSYGAPANGYKFDRAGTLAGINGTVAATDNPINSADYNATTTGSTILRWTNLTIETGNTVNLQTTLPLNGKYPVLNAFIIKGLALAVDGPSIDTQPASASINEGENTTLTVSATASEGSLSYQWYRGATGDTSNPVGTDSASFTTPALSQTTGYWVAVTDGTTNTVNSETAVVTVQQSGTAQRILFIGNSFTNGYVVPMQPYNNANVTDLNGTDYGGIPGILKKLADDTGYPIVVGIESVNGSTLVGRYPSKVGLITSPTWDRYVLQGRSQEAMADWRGADALASQFNTTVGNWNTAILNANPSAEVWLYAPWASPKFIGETIDGVNTYYTNAEGKETYLEEIYNAYHGAATALNLTGWVPVGEAFMDAFEGGLTQLWISDEHHASAAGSYLAAVMFYKHLLGGDPRLLPTGLGSAVADLGVSQFQADTIHQLVYDFVLTPPTPKPTIDTHPASVTINEGETATLTVSATLSEGGGALSYQWYEGDSGITTNPISGATSASYTTPTLNTPGDYNYWARVSDDNGFANSNTATLTVTATPGTPGESAWIAYHNTEVNAVNPLDDSLISKGNTEGTAYELKNVDDGSSANGATITVTRSGSWNNGTNAAAVMPTVGDADTLFGGKININGRFNWAQNTSTAIITFRNLPAGTYDLALVINRGNDGNLTRLTLQNASAYEPADTPSVVMTSNNTNVGEVARWTEIVASGESDTSFSILVEKESGSYHYLPQLVRLAYTPPAPTGPTVDTQPASTTIANGETATLSVTATASGGELSYQWYQGTSSTTTTPVGTNSASYTTPALTETTSYWVRVTDGNGSVDSDTATVTVEAAPPTTSFATWVSDSGLTGDDALDDADPDGDGVVNLLEYAFDLNPTSGNSASGLPGVATENDAGTNYLTLTYRKNLDAPDLTYTIETSTTLAVDSWTPATVESDTVVTADPDGDGSAELRKARVAISGEKQFLRMKVAQ